MRKFTFTLAAMAIASMSMQAEQARSGPQAPAAEPEVTEQAPLKFGQAPLAPAQKEAESVAPLHAPAKAAEQQRILPANGSFIDDPSLPYLSGFSYTYPYPLVQIDEKTMGETILVEDGGLWPTTLYLRQGNYEGTDFTDNPAGTTVMQGSFDIAGNKNWQYTKFVSKDDWAKRPLRAAYDVHENRVYALAEAIYDSREYYAFISYSPTDLSDVKVIKTDIPADQYCNAITWDPRDGSIVGVSVTGDVLRFDKKTGNSTLLLSTGQAQDNVYFGGLVFSPKDNAFIWAHLTTSGGYTTGQDYYLIDTDAKTYKLITSQAKANGINQISALMVNQQYVNPLAAAPVTITNDAFAAHAGAGDITVTLPNRLENGENIIGDLKLVARINGTNTEGTKELSYSSRLPGEQVKCSIYGMQPGLHRISFYTVNSQGQWSRAMNLAKYVGYDTPCQPQEVTLTANKLTWQPVTQGIHGQNIAADGIEYTVWLDGEMLGTTTSTSYDMNFDPIELASHLAAVQAVNHDNASAPGYSNRITVGEYRTVPATIVPNTSDLMLSQAIDLDQDERTWGYNESNKAFIKQKGATGAPNNDWLILPPVNFDDPDALYEISFEYRTGNYTEGIELLLSDKAEAATGTAIISKELNTNSQFTTLSTVLNAGGVKYLLFHPTKQQADIYVRNIKVTKTGGSASSPAAVADLVITPGAEGALTHQVDFTFPAVSVAGQALDPEAKILVTITGTGINAAPTTGTPGSKGSINFSCKEGLTTVTLTPAINNIPGMPKEATFFSGEDVPGFVKNFSVTLGDNPYEVHLSWDEPGNIGQNGGWASSDDLVYYIMIKRPGASKWSRTEPIDFCDAVFTINEGFEQEHVQWGIMTENKKGCSNLFPNESITCGPAYTLPMRETMPGGYPEFNPIIVDDPTDEFIGSAGYANPAAIKPEYAVKAGNVIGLMPPDDEKAGKAMIVLPYFSTEGIERPAVNIRALIDPDVTAQADVYATAYGMEPVKIGSWNGQTPGHGYTNLHFPIPQFKNKKWVQVAVVGTFEGGPTPRFVVIERYTMSETYDNEFSIISAVTPGNVRVNRQTNVVANICNHSASEKPCPKVKFTLTDAAGNVTVTEYTDAQPIGADEEFACVFPVTPNADQLGELNVKLELEDDDVLHNNVVEATGCVQVGNAVMPENITAARRLDTPTSVDITWSEPYVFPGTEDMETMPTFSIDEQIGEFRNLDLDGSQTYTWANWSFPHEEEPHAFIVFDDRYDNIPATSKAVLTAHSGHQFLLALSPLNYVTASDWLISPEVEPGTEVSFWLSTVSTAYGYDQVSLYTSTGSENPADFEHLAYRRKNTEGWEQLSCTLPDDAKRFAIVFHSCDTFGVLIDDISYTPAGGIVTLEGFEIERDGQPIGEMHQLDYAFTDTDAPEHLDFKYNVTPFVRHLDGTLAKGETSPTALVKASSAVATLAADKVSVSVNGGLISVTGTDNATLAAADGKLIPATSHGQFRVTPGIYILSAEGATWKILVR